MEEKEEGRTRKRRRNRNTVDEAMADGRRQAVGAGLWATDSGVVCRGWATEWIMTALSCKEGERENT